MSSIARMPPGEIATTPGALRSRSNTWSELLMTVRPSTPRTASANIVIVVPESSAMVSPAWMKASAACAMPRFSRACACAREKYEG